MNQTYELPNGDIIFLAHLSYIKVNGNTIRFRVGGRWHDFAAGSPVQAKDLRDAVLIRAQSLEQGFKPLGSA